MTKLAAICAVLCGLLVQPVQANTYTIKDRPFLGIATRLTCKDWLDDFVKNGQQSKQYGAWLRGYLSGYNMLYESSRHMLFEYEMPWAMKLTTTFCQKIPETLMSTSGANVVAFYNEIHENALQHNKGGFKRLPSDSDHALHTRDSYYLIEDTDRSCHTWLDRQAKNDSAAVEDDKAYIFGFFSAYNQFTKNQAYSFTNVDEPMLLDVVRQGCNGRQQQHIVHAMMDYIVRLQAGVAKQQNKSAK